MSGRRLRAASDDHFDVRLYNVAAVEVRVEDPLYLRLLESKIRFIFDYLVSERRLRAASDHFDYT